MQLSQPTREALAAQLKHLETRIRELREQRVGLKDRLASAETMLADYEQQKAEIEADLTR